MRFLRKALRYTFGASVLFLGINYGWTHAALAYVATNTPCPDTLKTEASSAVETLFGNATANPLMMCIDGPTLGLKVEYGNILFAPMLPSIIVLGPNGQNSDVAAHEFAHAELKQRTSFLLRSYKIPTWFDEGLAMQLDHRSAYTDLALKQYLSEPNAAFFTRETLEKPSAFFVRGDIGAMHYAFAKCVVGNWLRGHEGHLISFIDNVSWTENFPSTEFDQSESTCLIL